MDKEFYAKDVDVYFGKQSDEPMRFKNPFEGMIKLWITHPESGAEHIWGKLITFLRFGQEDDSRVIGGVFELLITR